MTALSSGKRARPGYKEFVGRPNALATVLADLRRARGLSLRDVEDATGKAGDLLPSEGKGAPRARLAAVAIADLTAEEEEEEQLKYLAFLRSRNSS